MEEFRVSSTPLTSPQSHLCTYHTSSHPHLPTPHTSAHITPLHTLTSPHLFTVSPPHTPLTSPHPTLLHTSHLFTPSPPHTLHFCTHHTSSHPHLPTHGTTLVQGVRGGSLLICHSNCVLCCATDVVTCPRTFLVGHCSDEGVMCMVMCVSGGMWVNDMWVTMVIVSLHRSLSHTCPP